MRNSVIALLWFLLIAAFAREAIAVDRSVISARKPPTLLDLPSPKFATSTVKPWGFINRQGQEDGLLVRFEQALERETGIAYQNHLQPYPRVLHSLASGAVDFAVIFDSHAPDEQAIRVGYVTTIEIMVVARAGGPLRASMSELAGMQIGYIRGSKYGSQFDEATHFTRVPINKIEQGIAMVLKGRIEAMASTDQSLYWALDNMGVKAGDLAKIISIGKTTGGLYMSKKSQRKDLLPIYRKALQQMKATGTMARIFYRQDAWASAK